jgi:DNA invertase Pin-like site-specific DNA recombinase
VTLISCLALSRPGVEFVACDMPNRLTVGIMALVAEEERKAICQRTKAALAAAKARDVRLGAPKRTKVRGSEVGRLRGAKATAANAKAFAERMRGVFDELADLPASAAARELERRGYATPCGGKWSAIHVIRIRARLEASS